MNAKSINEMTDICHKASHDAGWWSRPDEMKDENGDFVVDSLDWRDIVTPTKLALIHSEVSEAMEGFRKDINDDHLPHRKMAEVELADTMIRIFDLAGAHGYDLGGAIIEKMAYNAQRADHKPDARAASDGKKF